MVKSLKEFKDWYCSKGNQLHFIAKLLMIWVSLFIIHIYLVKVAHAPYNVIYTFEGIIMGISIALPTFGFFRMGIMAGIVWVLIGGSYCYGQFYNGHPLIELTVSVCLTITMILYFKAAKIIVLAIASLFLCYIMFDMFSIPEPGPTKLTPISPVSNTIQH